MDFMHMFGNSFLSIVGIFVRESVCVYEILPIKNWPTNSKQRWLIVKTIAQN